MKNIKNKDPYKPYDTKLTSSTSGVLLALPALAVDAFVVALVAVFFPPALEVGVLAVFAGVSATAAVAAFLFGGIKN
ncbi:hypothetical protein BGX26_007542 [Mortierella sp. AD094]|nr:hypothetical protein BGX26_007542 [Mortierella sp. AD094]